jgi:DHA2 family multidrug resistance protein
MASGAPPGTAQQGALVLLNAQVMRQAAMLSYNDAWGLLLMTFVIVTPAILLLRKPRPQIGPPPEAH